MAQGKLPGSGNWPVLVMKPGQNPQEALAGAMVSGAVLPLMNQYTGKYFVASTRARFPDSAC